MDDVRPFSWDSPLTVYGSRETIEEFRERFSYVFKETQQGGGKPRIIPAVAKPGVPIAVGSLLFSPIPVEHGALSILGWRIDEAAGNTAGHRLETGAVYLTDTSAIPDSSWPLIGSPAVLIIGALRTRPHATHFNFEQALDAAARTGARQTFLTHICHDHYHRDIEEYCRNYQENHELLSRMGPAYDGLELTV
jgi:phosphoribosyl 1,2-cyclic phosphate phosphodiesterase